MNTFTARDPNFAARIRDSFERQPFMETVGAALSRVEPGRVEIEAPFADHITQQHGFVHGGVIGAIADSAAGYAAYTLMAVEDSVLTVEYKLNLLAPAKGETIVAKAEVIRPGRTLTIVRSDVLAIDGGEETLCATAVVTLIRMAGQTDHAVG
jgi:uncharacterized protein (TIGR00369 family)